MVSNDHSTSMNGMNTTNNTTITIGDLKIILHHCIITASSTAMCWGRPLRQIRTHFRRGGHCHGSFAIIESFESFHTGIKAFPSSKSICSEWRNWRLFSLNRRIQLMLNEVLAVFNRTGLRDFSVTSWSMMWMLCVCVERNKNKKNKSIWKCLSMLWKNEEENDSLRWKESKKRVSLISFKFESYWELWWGTKYTSRLVPSPFKIKKS